MAAAQIPPEEGKKRADAAFAAMEKLGIQKSRVKPVLKRLLIASDYQWEFVENDNYLALVDAIFEPQDTAKEGCSRKNEERLVDENGHREKRLKSCQESESNNNNINNNNNNNNKNNNNDNIMTNGPTCQPSENRGPTQKQPFTEQNNTSSSVNKPLLSIPSSSSKPQVQNKPESSRARDEETSNKALVQVKNEGYKIVLHKNGGSSFTCPSERDDLSNNNNLHNSSERKRIGMSNNGSNSSERKKGQEVIEPMPLAMVYPNPNNQENASRKRAYKGKAKVTEIAEPSFQFTNLEIASNESKDVNISFICNDSILTDPNFRSPSLEEICKQVEAKCMPSYKTLNPNFSLLNILTEMCKTYKEIGYTPLEKRNKIIKIIPAPGAEHLFQGHGIPKGITHLGYSSSNPNFNNLSLVPFTTPIPPHDHEDISRGLEKIKIPIQTDPNSKEEYPPEFRYISSNLSYQNAYVSISLARIGDESCCFECHGDCLQSPFPCACAAETGGCFAYTKEGLLREEFLEGCMERLRNAKKSDLFYCKEKCPLEMVNGKRGECKGHLVRKFIKECWAKCGCKLQCGNRVVQRGITCNLQIFKSSEEIGWGIRTLSFLPKGSFVCEYVGVVLTNTELYELITRRSNGGSERHTYPVLLDADWGTEGILKDEELLCLDATHYGNVARFINHRCHDGNLIGIPVEIETPDHHYYHLAFFTNRDVSSMEELTWDYAIDFNDHNHPIPAFQCKCGSPYCRDVKIQQITKTRSRQGSNKFVSGS